jgi:hypothetical protein
MEIIITIKYGLDSISKTFTQPVYVRDIKANASVRAALGFGDNIRVLMNGVELPDGAQLSNGSLVIIETACNTKA